MKITCIAFLAALTCASCTSIRHTREMEGIARRESALATLAREKEIKNAPDADSFARDLVAITKKKMREFRSWGDGETASQPSASDRTAILRLILKETDEPLLLIEEYTGGRVHVETGVVRGPLDGGGRSFYLIKTKSSWRIVYSVGWVS